MANHTDRKRPAADSGVGLQCSCGEAELTWRRERQREGSQLRPRRQHHPHRQLSAHLAEEAARQPGAWLKPACHGETALPLMASRVQWLACAICFWNHHPTLCVRNCQNVQTVIQILMEENQQPFIIAEEQLLTAFILGELHGKPEKPLDHRPACVS